MLYTIRGVSVEFPHAAYDCQLQYMEKIIQALQEVCYLLLARFCCSLVELVFKTEEKCIVGKSHWHRKNLMFVVCDACVDCSRKEEITRRRRGTKRLI